MCGRAVLTSSPEALREVLGLHELPVVTASYNIPPSRPIAVVRAGPHGPGRPRHLEMLRWGLLPSWSDDPSIAQRLTLARAETVSTTRAYRDLVRSRRCLVIVDGFYEWRRAGKAPSQPFFFHGEDRRPLALAGLWDRWVSPVGEVVESCAIVTQAARPPALAVHDRMPLVLPAASWDRWLDPAVHDVADLLAPQAPALVAVQVSPAVNDPRHDAPDCLDPWAPAQRSLFS